MKQLTERNAKGERYPRYRRRLWVWHNPQQLLLPFDEWGLMPRKPKPPPDDPEQSKRFIEIADEVGANDDSEALESALKKASHKARTKPRA
jgi:hypothetical protein